MIIEYGTGVLECFTGGEYSFKNAVTYCGLFVVNQA